MPEGSDRENNVPISRPGSENPNENQHSLIGSYYNSLQQGVNFTISEFESLYRWIERGKAIEELKDELKYFYREARKKWLDKYKQLKEPVDPTEAAEGVYEVCKLCVISYDAAISAENLSVFRIEFERLDDCVLRLSSRATAMLSEHAVPT